MTLYEYHPPLQNTLFITVDHVAHNQETHFFKVQRKCSRGFIPIKFMWSFHMPHYPEVDCFIFPWNGPLESQLLCLLEDHRLQNLLLDIVHTLNKKPLYIYIHSAVPQPECSSLGTKHGCESGLSLLHPLKGELLILATLVSVASVEVLVNQKTWLKFC